VQLEAEIVDFYVRFQRISLLRGRLARAGEGSGHHLF
jgi:hypothetical protein